MMTNKEVDVAVVVGRWQLFHKGQETLLNKALEVAERVVVVIGSSFRSRDPKNPFNWEERAEMIRAAYGEDVSKRLLILPVRDYFDDEKWNTAVRVGVERLVGTPKRVKLVGFFKDSSSYYLRNFKGWELVEVTQERRLDATELRNVYFGSDSAKAAMTVLKSYVSSGVLDYLQAWARLSEYSRRCKEHLAVEAYKLAWPADAYNAANSVVQVGSHVLFVKRSDDIGNGLWALPGGFVGRYEDFLTAAIRKLRDKTNFGVLDLSIRDALKGSRLFDHPHRSARGRVVSVAHYFRFGSSSLPEVRPGEGVSETRWFHVDELADMEEQIFEDDGRPLSHFLQLEQRGLS